MKQFLNVLVKKYMSDNNYVEYGRNYKFYDPSSVLNPVKYAVGPLPGFKISCEVYERIVPKLLLDFSSKIIRID